MKPIVLPLDWRRYADPRLLVDARGATRDHYPTARDIPVDLHVAFDPAGRVTGLSCHYRKPFIERTREWAVMYASVVVYEKSGLIESVRLLATPGAMPYESLETPIAAFLIQARCAKDRNRWPTIFSAEVLCEFWKNEKDVLRRVLSPTAPYR